MDYCSDRLHSLGTREDAPREFSSLGFLLGEVYIAPFSFNIVF